VIGVLVHLVLTVVIFGGIGAGVAVSAARARSKAARS
jgi:hypothetical protein